MTPPAAASINRYDDPYLDGWDIKLPHGETDGREPAHVHVTNVQKNFRGKIWIKADNNFPPGKVERYSYVLDKKTAATTNKRTEEELFSALRRAFASNLKGIVEFFEETWKGDWYHGS